MVAFKIDKNRHPEQSDTYIIYFYEGEEVVNARGAESILDLAKIAAYHMKCYEIWEKRPEENPQLESMLKSPTLIGAPRSFISSGLLLLPLEKDEHFMLMEASVNFLKCEFPELEVLSEKIGV